MSKLRPSQMLTALMFSLMAVLVSGSAQARQVSIVVSGLGGTEQYQQQFDRYAATIAEHSRSIASDPQDTYLMPGDASSREAILQTLASVAQRQPAAVALYLIGHGSFDGHEYKFNVPGPDISGSDLQLALDDLGAAKQLVVVATSASGALLPLLEADNRLLMTATKSGRERNAVKFPQFLAEGLGEITADLNKDEVISVNELFDYTDNAVSAHYESEKLLAPEHPRLRGVKADTFHVARYGTLLNAADTIDPALMQRRTDISEQINSLRARKDELGEDQYFDALQSLMLELSEVQAQIRNQGEAQ